MDSDRKKTAILNQLISHYGYQHWWESENRIQDWVSMILIQQTTQLNMERALDNLSPYMTVEGLLNLTDEKLQQLILPAGFYKQKSSYIKALMEWFQSHGQNLEKFEQIETPELRTELLSIKGVGPETADAMLLYIFDRKVFIGDQYAIRLFNRLGFGPYKNLGHMRKEFHHLTEEVTVKTCKEWHAVIDVHGKMYRTTKEMDESWLIE